MDNQPGNQLRRPAAAPFSIAAATRLVAALQAEHTQENRSLLWIHQYGRGITRARRSTMTAAAIVSASVAAGATSSSTAASAILAHRIGVGT